MFINILNLYNYNIMVLHPINIVSALVQFTIKKIFERSWNTTFANNLVYCWDYVCKLGQCGWGCYDSITSVSLSMEFCVYHCDAGKHYTTNQTIYAGTLRILKGRTSLDTRWLKWSVIFSVTGHPRKKSDILYKSQSNSHICINSTLVYIKLRHVFVISS